MTGEGIGHEARGLDEKAALRALWLRLFRGERAAAGARRLLGMNILNAPNVIGLPSGASRDGDRVTKYVGDSLDFPSGIAIRDRLVLVLHAYLDDSGTHGGSNAVAVAGYISTADQWVLFESEWNKALEDWGLKHFHMTDFANRVKVYRHWTDEERRTRLARLVGIINRHTLVSIAIVVPVKSFIQTFSKEARQIIGGAYGLAAFFCFWKTTEIIDRVYPSSKISYVFESGTRGAGEILKVFQLLRFT